MGVYRRPVRLSDPRFPERAESMAARINARPPGSLSVCFGFFPGSYTVGEFIDLFEDRIADREGNGFGFVFGLTDQLQNVYLSTTGQIRSTLPECVRESEVTEELGIVP